MAQRTEPDGGWRGEGGGGGGNHRHITYGWLKWGRRFSLSSLREGGQAQVTWPTRPDTACAAVVDPYACMGCAQDLLGTAHVDMADDKRCGHFPLICTRQHGNNHSCLKGRGGRGAGRRGAGAHHAAGLFGHMRFAILGHLRIVQGPGQHLYHTCVRLNREHQIWAPRPALYHRCRAWARNAHMIQSELHVSLTIQDMYRW